jgi:HYPK UBA domain
VVGRGELVYFGVQALATVLAAEVQAQQGRLVAEKLLERVPVTAEGVKFLEAEFGLDAATATRRLREASGDVAVAALRLARVLPDDGGKEALQKIVSSAMASSAPSGTA